MLCTAPYVLCVCTGFANPPGMINCSVRGAPSGQVEFTISWTPPVLTGVGNLRYNVDYEIIDHSNDRFDVDVAAYDLKGNATNFILPDPNVPVDIFVNLNRPVNGARAGCVIDPALRCKKYWLLSFAHYF